MSVEFSYASSIIAVETLEANVPAARPSNAQVRHDLYNTVLTAQAAEECAFFEVQLTGGDGAIDFTALPSTNGREVDGTGLLVKALKFMAPETNAEPVAIEAGESDGLDLGVTVGALEPGGEITLLFPIGVEVKADEKILDLTGDTNEKLQVAVLLVEPPAGEPE